MFCWVDVFVARGGFFFEGVWVVVARVVKFMGGAASCMCGMYDC
jgi:hypothetical protein